MQLLLLPGMDGTGRLFAPLLKALPPSLPATVISYPNQSAIGYERMLPDVEAGASDLDEFVVVGESFSGPLALMLAARRPKGLRGVVLCASFIRSPRRLLAATKRLVHPWMFRVQPSRLIVWALLGGHRDAELRCTLLDAIRSLSAATLAARLRCIASVDVTQELRKCAVPLMYLRATDDLLVPASCLTEIKEIRPDCRTSAIVGPHLILQTAPEASARELEGFCRAVSVM